MSFFHTKELVLASAGGLLCFILLIIFLFGIERNPPTPPEHTALVPIEVSVAELEDIFTPLPVEKSNTSSDPTDSTQALPKPTVPTEQTEAPAEPAPEFAEPPAPPQETQGPETQSTTTLPLPEPAPQGTLTQNEIIQQAMMNILCIARAGSGMSSISGSGIVIDGKGTVLTNAHIAQMFLLTDYPVKDSVSCTIRTGSPATDTYTAELTYLSPRWIFENANAIATKNPVGTGKDDFALLSITAPTQTSAALPSPFIHLPLSFTEMSLGQSVISAGYPASFLESETIRRGLVLIAISGTIRDVFTFGTNTADVLSLGGIALAQQGASGGAVVRANNTSVGGLIVTSSLEPDTLERDLRAISTAHIARSFQEQHGKSFATTLGEDMRVLRQEFLQSTAPVLRELLIQALAR